MIGIGARLTFSGTALVSGRASRGRITNGGLQSNRRVDIIYLKRVALRFNSDSTDPWVSGRSRGYSG
jgi:hypothetical protein